MMWQDPGRDEKKKALVLTHTHFFVLNKKAYEAEKELSRVRLSLRPTNEKWQRWQN